MEMHVLSNPDGHKHALNEYMGRELFSWVYQNMVIYSSSGLSSCVVVWDIFRSWHLDVQTYYNSSDNPYI